MASELGEPNVARLAEELTGAEMLRWQAWFTLQASERDPEPTEWDDKESYRAKLRRKAEAKARTR